MSAFQAKGTAATFAGLGEWVCSRLLDRLTLDFTLTRLFCSLSSNVSLLLPFGSLQKSEEWMNEGQNLPTTNSLMNSNRCDKEPISRKKWALLMSCIMHWSAVGAICVCNWKSYLIFFTSTQNPNSSKHIWERKMKFCCERNNNIPGTGLGLRFSTCVGRVFDFWNVDWVWVVDFQSFERPSRARF